MFMTAGVSSLRVFVNHVTLSSSGDAGSRHDSPTRRSAQLISRRKLAGLTLSFRPVWEQLLRATFVEAGDVRPCAVQSPLEFVSFTQKLATFREKVLVLLPEPVPIVFDPGAVRLSQLSQQVARELALGGKLAAKVAYFVFGIERPFPPRRFFLSRPLLDPSLGARLGPRLRLSDDRVGCVVLICERARYPGELGDAHAGDGSPGST